MDINSNNNYLNNNFDCFHSLEFDDLQIINSKKTRISFFKGETIFKQGAFAPHVLFINSGLVKVYLQTDRNKQVNIRIAKQGNFMAFSSIFRKNTYLYSAVALKDSTICMVDKQALKKLLLQNTDFAMQMNSKNCDNENRYIDIIYNLSHKQMRGKLASALIYLSQDEFKDDNIFEYLSRQDIANFASITVESAVKFIKEFEKEGIITLDGKKITIKDPISLEDINIKG